MTSYLTNTTLGVMSPIVAKDKGDISNRTKCAGAQFVNNAQMLLADTVVLGGAAGVTKLASKSGKFAQFLEKFMRTTKFGNMLSKVGNAIGKNFKTTAPILAIALPLLAYINHKHSYKAGQIDQRYTDKAKLEESRDIL